MRILIVDDEPTLRKSLRRLLREHEVVEAPSANAACKALVTEPEIDAVISDVMMPGGTGADLHRWVLEHRPDLATHFIFMTGGVPNPELRRYVDGAGAPILTKPSTISEVKELLAGFIS